MPLVEVITYVDDYCFDCGVMCKQKDEEHKDHKTLSKQKRFRYDFLIFGKLPVWWWNKLKAILGKG
jgi:hypothetical protein